MGGIQKYGCFLFLFAFLISCKEKFDDNLPFLDINALVVDGEINDNPGFYMVKLTKSVSFNSNKNVMVGNAEVYVVDDLNNRYDFKEKGAGLYYSDSASFRGQTGRTYTLLINTDDSLSYKSTPCTIGQPSRLDSVFFTSQTDFGCQINGNISFGSDKDMKIRIDASIASGYSIDSFSGAHHKITTFYPSINSLNYVPVLKANTDYIKGSIIKNLPFFYFSYPIPRSDLTKGYVPGVLYYKGYRFIIIINAYTVSNETFNYYNSLKMQMSGNDVFFEPTPFQLIGNIKCINNKTKSVYGLFQANVLIRKYFKYIDWSGKMMELRKIPDIDIENIDTLEGKYVIRY